VLGVVARAVHLAREKKTKQKNNYKLLSRLVSTGDKEYVVLVEELSEHFTPAPSEIVKRFKFQENQLLLTWFNWEVMQFWGYPRDHVEGLYCLWDQQQSDLASVIVCERTNLQDSVRNSMESAAKNVTTRPETSIFAIKQK